MVLRVLGVLGLVVVLACGLKSDPAHGLENRLYSPCCWRQILADHESPVASQLRAEIRERLAAGEAADSIERGLIERYGDRISAAGTSGPGPGVMIGVVTGASAILGLLVLARVMGRRRRAIASIALMPTVLVEDDAFIDRLDDELAAID